MASGAIQTSATLVARFAGTLFPRVPQKYGLTAFLLQINFVDEARIISTMDPTPSVLEHWQANWLSELAVNKSTHYPNFRSLILRESHSQGLDRWHDHLSKTNCHQVELPEGAKLEFETNSIAFQGWARR
jgi:hypothetical protein